MVIVSSALWSHASAHTGLEAGTGWLRALAFISSGTVASRRGGRCPALVRGERLRRGGKNSQAAHSAAEAEPTCAPLRTQRPAPSGARHFSLRSSQLPPQPSRRTTPSHTAPRRSHRSVQPGSPSSFRAARAPPRPPATTHSSVQLLLVIDWWWFRGRQRMVICLISVVNALAW